MVHGISAWVGARCWLAGRGRGLFCDGFLEPVTSLLGGCNMKWISCSINFVNVIGNIGHLKPPNKKMVCSALLKLFYS